LFYSLERIFPMPKTLVMKFGGTSIGTVAAMRQAVEITVDVHRDWERLVVVTSAISGVTDLLINSATSAMRGDLVPFQQAKTELSERHFSLIDGLVSRPECQEDVRRQISGLFTEFSNLCHAIHVLGECTPRAMDAVAGLGERLSVPILAAAVESAGLPVQAFESTAFIITDDHFQNALPDMVETTRLTHQVLDPILSEGIIPVVTGFIGATPGGLPTTLGRGGSDFTASIMALALKADEVWIWTDVDGVMTADPRLVPQARTLPVLSYREVAELAHFGAKVLQPRSIYPVIQAGIPVRVCNTFNPTHPGTRLVSDNGSNGNGTIKAMAALRGLQLITLGGRGMLGVPGVAGRVFSSTASTGISIPWILQSTSEQSICFAVPKESVGVVLQALRRDLSHEFERQDIDRAEGDEEVDIITLLCPGLRATSGVAALIFNRLSSAMINVLAISFGASDHSINLVVSAANTVAALQALHELTNLEVSHA
jgi:bifunctional aspartokinase / homoserine dehydrogenase 1